MDVLNDDVHDHGADAGTHRRLVRSPLKIMGLTPHARLDVE